MLIEGCIQLDEDFEREYVGGCLLVENVGVGVFWVGDGEADFDGEIDGVDDDDDEEEEVEEDDEVAVGGEDANVRFDEFGEVVERGEQELGLLLDGVLEGEGLGGISGIGLRRRASA